MPPLKMMTGMTVTEEIATVDEIIEVDHLHLPPPPVTRTTPVSLQDLGRTAPKARL